GCPTSSSPKYAVRPVAPKTPRLAEGGDPSGSFRHSSGLTKLYSRQPPYPVTKSPGFNLAERDSTTSPTKALEITCPISNGGTYERRSRIRPRRYGSTEINFVRSNTSPSAGSPVVV